MLPINHWRFSIAIVVVFTENILLDSNRTSMTVFRLIIIVRVPVLLAIRASVTVSMFMRVFMGMLMRMLMIMCIGCISTAAINAHTIQPRS